MADYTYVTYETLEEGRIARLYLNRADARNAQHFGLLGDLHEAFLRAEADDDVRVVILGGLGPAFPAGHDLGPPERQAERAATGTAHPFPYSASDTDDKRPRPRRLSRRIPRARVVSPGCAKGRERHRVPGRN